MSQSSADPTPPTGGTAAAAGSRRYERHSLDAPLRLELDGAAVEGLADNVSRVGMMLFTDQPIRVTVEVDGFRDGRRLTGKLVRLQRMDEVTTGIAIEFDELIDANELG